MVEREGREAPCQTAEIPLGMPADDEDLDAAGRAVGRPTCRTAGATCSRSATGTPRAGCSPSRPSAPSSRAPIVPGQPDLLAEAAIAARLEQARSVADVLLRRTRLGVAGRAPASHAPTSVTPVAEAMGERARLERPPRPARRRRPGWRPPPPRGSTRREPARPSALADILPPPWRRGSNDLHLADLHARAAELGVPRYRMLRRDQLVAQIPSATARRDRTRRVGGGGRGGRPPTRRRRERQA